MDLKFYALPKTYLNLYNNKNLIKSTFRKEYLKEFKKNSWTEWPPGSCSFLRDLGVIRWLGSWKDLQHPLLGTILEFKNYADLVLYKTKYSGLDLGYGGNTQKPKAQFFVISDDNQKKLKSLDEQMNINLEQRRNIVMDNSRSCISFDSMEMAEPLTDDPNIRLFFDEIQKFKKTYDYNRSYMDIKTKTMIQEFTQLCKEYYSTIEDCKR